MELLKERFADWQKKGYIPNSKIEEGEKTSEPIRTRGWVYWHQLFNPRQLLEHGLLMELIDKYAKTKKEKVMGLLGVNKCCNWNSKLSRWISDAANEKGSDTFSNQALNTLYNYNTRTYLSIFTSWFYNINNYRMNSNYSLAVSRVCQLKGGLKARPLDFTGFEGYKN